MARVTTETYGNLVDLAKYVGSIDTAIPVLVKTTGGVVKAGTLVAGDGGSILKGTATKVVATNDATTEGVLQYDVDTSGGDFEGAMIIRGILDLTKVTAGNGAAPAATVALKDIQFVK